MCRHRRTSTRKLIEQLHRKADAIMGKQDTLNEYVAAINSAIDDVRSDLETLKQREDVDLSGLEASVGRLKALAEENPAPQEPTEPPAEPGTGDTGDATFR